MKTYLVAGGAGFIGSHMVEALLKRGEKVICVDNFLTGLEINIKHFQKLPNFKLIKADISDQLLVEERLDYILNYACPASPIDYRKYAVETMLACSDGVKNLLDLAKRENARFFHTSTSEVYGDPAVHPQSEGYWGNVNPYGERSCYDEGKRYAEALIYLYRKDFGVNTAIVRIFNTYGPRLKANDGRVVSSFINQALKDRPITVFGDGSQTRSFCYVDDQIEGHLKLIHSNESGPINIGNDREFTMLELAHEIISLTNSKSKIVFLQLPADDPTQRQPDVTLAKKNLDWEPKTTLTDGLKKTIDWYKNN